MSTFKAIYDVISQDDQKYKYIDKMIKESKSSDHIEFCDSKNDDTLHKMLSLTDALENNCVPGDILFMNNIPLMDFKLSYKKPANTDPSLHVGRAGEKLNVRFVIYKDFYKRITNSIDPIINIGCMVVSYPDYPENRTFTMQINKYCDVDFVAEIFLDKDNLTCFISDKILSVIKFSPNDSDSLKNFTINMIKSAIKHDEETLEEDNTILINDDDIFIINLRLWYNIQVALLHPTIKDVFAHPRLESITKETTVRKKGKVVKKRTVKYIKRHVINPDNIERKKNNRSFNRRTLAWYVVGHWRTCPKSKKKYFVKGFWKGELREAKIHESELRKREIVIPENITE